MYLTRVFLNPNRRHCRYLVSSRQRLHAAVLRSFPPGALEAAEGEGRVLWRLDQPEHRWSRAAALGRISQSGGNPALALYISSPVAPDPSELAENAGYETEGGVAVKRIDGLLDSLAAGQHWGFKITVNPTFRKAGTVDARGRKKQLGHVTVAQQTQWLLDRTAANGFVIPSVLDRDVDLPHWEFEDRTELEGRDLMVSLVDRSLERFQRGRGDDSRQVTLQLATFQGVLEVQDPALLRAALVGGIGRAKGYGSGLLTLARL